MSGFVGFTGAASVLGNDEYSRNILSSMLDCISHRGPDGKAFYKDTEFHAGVCRLSIQDTPLRFAQHSMQYGGFAAAFDGEIYNKEELMTMLKCSPDDADAPRCSTELLVRLYERFGGSFVKNIRGMFSLVIWNCLDHTLFAARDCFGIKPFYYAVIHGELIFASEIKSILKYPLYTPEINEKALEAYLDFGCCVLPETLFKGIYRLSPGHSMTFSEHAVQISEYRQIEFTADSCTPIENFVEEINEAMKNSVACHCADTLQNQIPTGAFLAAGIDSNYITALLNGEMGFSVSFDFDKRNDVNYANTLADILKVDNYRMHVTTEQCWEALPNIVYRLEEPLADPSAIAQYFAYQNAAGHAKVILSGDGADELFGGYQIYSEPEHLKSYSRLPAFVKKAVTQYAPVVPAQLRRKKYGKRCSQSLEERYLGATKSFTEKEIIRLFKNNSGNGFISGLIEPYYCRTAAWDDVAKMQYIDIHFRLCGNVLAKADKLAMAHSLEVRMPYLDPKVFDVAKKLPTAYKISSVNNKIALRLAASRYLPEAVTRKKRTKREIPIAAWIRNEHYYQTIKNLFLSDTAMQYFNTNVLMQYLEAHRSCKADYSGKIWTVYMFLLWHRIYFET